MQIPKETKLLDQEAKVEEITQKGAKNKEINSNHRATMKVIYLKQICRILGENQVHRATMKGYHGTMPQCEISCHDKA
jgi:hypothetical protein